MADSKDSKKKAEAVEEKEDPKASAKDANNKEDAKAESKKAPAKAAAKKDAKAEKKPKAAPKAAAKKGAKAEKKPKAAAASGSATDESSNGAAATAGLRSRQVSPQDKVRILLKSFDHRILDSLVQQILETIERTGAQVAGPVPLPTARRRFTIIRSPHIDKDSREYFELRVHKRLMDIIKPSSRTIDALNSLNAPAGVDITIKLTDN